jgi:hypothetical protein
MTPSRTLTELEWAVRAIAQRAADQLAMFHPAECAADELVDDLDLACRAARREGLALGQAADALLAQLDAAIDAMSGPAHMEFWCDEGLREAPAWALLRALAWQLIEIMGWPTEPTPPGRFTYVFV